jgi:NAD-dependent SIR2 family protein deacetylase
MASTALKTEEEKQEFFDSPEDLDIKIEMLANWVNSSSHFIVFTGAGISTSAGIPDFRSGYNTVLPTGPGAWEKLAQDKPVVRRKVVEFKSAVPTSTHMSFVELMHQGKLKYVVSQNVDGLHRKSGIPPTCLAELHGNVYVERCLTCQKDYLRDYETRTNSEVYRHETGNTCDNSSCGGDLADNIINFGENLDAKVIRAGFTQGRTADLCLSMGSSLRVNPAAQIPLETAQQGGKLVIVNIQRTPLDDSAALVINAFCDVVMEKLMAKLGYEIPGFKLIRHLKVTKLEEEGVSKLLFEGVDLDGSPYSIFRKLKITTADSSVTCRKPPYRIKGDIYGDFTVKLYFQGHYGEPPFTLSFNVDELVSSVTIRLTYDPYTGQWSDPETLTS